MLTLIQVALVFLAVHAVRAARNGDPCLRESAVTAALVWMGAILALTELLSLVRAVRLGPVMLFWSVANLCLIGFIYTRRASFNRKAFSIRRSPGGFESALLLGIVCVVAIAGLMGFVSPPNNPDGLSYHLPRQIYWLQQGSLEHFHTAEDKMLMMPPLTEIIGLHFRLLSGSDRWANAPQWLAYILTAIASSLVARNLGAGTRGQVLSAFLVVTIPMAFHQASSVKNDLLLGFLLTALCAQTMRDEQVKAGVASWLPVGVNLGLIWMVKGTGLIFSVPVMAYYGVRLLKGLRWRSIFPVAAITVTTIALSFGHYSRNLSWYGSPIGEAAGAGYDLRNDSIGMRGFASNLIRNTSVYMSSPSRAFNERVEGAVRRIHGWIGQDVEDPDTTFWQLKFAVFYRPNFETMASSQAHFVLGLITVCLVLFSRSGKRRRFIWIAYFLIPFSGYLLFALILKWQPWLVRLQLPLVCLLAPFIGGYLGDLRVFRSSAGIFAALFALVVFVPSIQSLSRPLFGDSSIFVEDRDDLYFVAMPELRDSNQAVLEIVKRVQPDWIRIWIPWGWTYPLQSWILRDVNPAPRFWGQVQKIPSNFPEMLIVKSYGLAELYKTHTGVDEIFQAVGETEPYTVYVRQSLAESTGLAETLPLFVGWRRDSGLGGLEYDPAGGRFRWRRAMLEAEVGLSFKPLNEPTRVSMRVEATQDGRYILTAAANGEVLCETAFDRADGPAEFSCELEGSSAGGDVIIRVDREGEPAVSKSNLYFTRLQVVEARREL